ncbi:hypothetical protein ElyMa_002935500 [Elysia marginata]|uniref:Uncharacterized protein n=1 Tax=Elysia marginata TaxID=1093978 RepID=A0AAV4I5K0_9GAST|nr:hypothetical protein ElyMa_002935500 [Elysia marginata]
MANCLLKASRSKTPRRFLHLLETSYAAARTFEVHHLPGRQRRATTTFCSSLKCGMPQHSGPSCRNLPCLCFMPRTYLAGRQEPVLFLGLAIDLLAIEERRHRWLRPL